jgi:hypothetical protein
MTRLGWFECLVLVAFFIAGLVSFLIDAGHRQMEPGHGYITFGYVVLAFGVVGIGWVVKELVIEYWEGLKTDYYREQVFQDWRENSRRKGMD